MDFQYFAEWCNSQVGYLNTEGGKISWAIDKDLLHKGNKIYAPDKCVFVPRAINSLIKKSSKIKSLDLPVGVTRVGKRFSVQCATVGSNSNYKGNFSDKYLAFAAYKNFKEAEIKRVALEYKGSIDPRLFASLMEWVINWND